MRIGIYIPAGPKDAIGSLLGSFERAEAGGFHSAWFGQLFDHDALTVLALAAQVTRTLELGTWVVPAPPRHPSALAQQALSVQAACDGRLVLGVGSSHRVIVEQRLGLDATRPLGHMEEYLQVLIPLLAGERVEHRGERLRVSLQIGRQGTSPPPVLLAALGPRMLELAARRADGVAIWLGGPRYLETTALPRLRASASGRSLRIVCGLPIVVTNDPPQARAAAASFLAQSSKLPAYRRVLERGGVESPADVALIGDTAEVARGLARLRDLGVDDFNAVIVPVREDPGARERTLDFLGSWASTGGS